MANLSIELLKCFVAVVEKGSIQKATERIFLTQSAISQQIRRLEEVLQRPLFRREANRKLTITPAGEELLGYAREILALNDRAISAVRGVQDTPLRVGVVQAFSEAKLPGILQHFSATAPQVRLDIRVGGTGDLFRALEDNQLDIALGVSSQPDDLGVVGHGPTCWMGGTELARQDLIPLAVLGDGCPYRKMAIQALKRADRPYYIAAEVQDLASLQVAIQAKLAVTCRPRPLVGYPSNDIIDPPLLPVLPQIHYVMHHNVAEGTPGWDLAEMFRTSFAEDSQAYDDFADHKQLLRA